MEPTNTTPTEPQQPQVSPQTTPPSGRGRSKATKWGVVAVIVVLFLGAAVYIKHTSSPSQPAQEAHKALTAQVEITAAGFVPETLNVPAGTKVTWVNKDSSPHRVASNPYPDNSGLPGLDSKAAIGPHDSYSYTFAKAGSFTYHDQYSPTTNGQVTVK